MAYFISGFDYLAKAHCEVCPFTIMVGSGYEVFSSSARQWEKFQDRSGRALANLMDIARHTSASGNFNDGEKRQHLEKMQKNIQKLVRIEAEAMHQEKACRTVSGAHLRETQDGEPIEDFMALYNKSMDNALRASEQLDPSTSGPVRNVAQLISALAPSDHEVSLQPSATTAMEKCPILLEEIKNPLMNLACGHVYSHDGALMLLKQKHRSGPLGAEVTKLDDFPPDLRERCPLSGCPKFFGPATLKRDYATELSVRQKKHTLNQNDDIDAVDVTMMGDVGGEFD